MDQLFGPDSRLLPDAAALLRAVRERPDDDTPRLVLADWVQDRVGDDFAELIRVQCALARRVGWVYASSAITAQAMNRLPRAKWFPIPMSSNPG